MYRLAEVPGLPPAELVAAIRWADSQCQVPGAPDEIVALRTAAARRLAEIIEGADSRYLNLAE